MMSNQIEFWLLLVAAPRLHPARAAALVRRIEPVWQARAGCLGAEDPDAWFPDEHAPPAQHTEPRAVCAQCPVARSCLAAGLLGGEHGLWGGVTREQRRAGLAAIAEGVGVDAVLDAMLDSLDTAAIRSERNVA